MTLLNQLLLRKNCIISDQYYCYWQLKTSATWGPARYQRDTNQSLSLIRCGHPKWFPYYWSLVSNGWDPLESHPRLRTLGGYLRNVPSSPQLEMAFPCDMMAFVKYLPTVTLTPALHINLIRRSIIFKDVMEGISSSIIPEYEQGERGVCAVRRKKPGM